MKMGIKILIFRIPKPGKEIVKGANTRCITNFKAADNSIQRINFKLCSLFSYRSNFKINGKQVGTLHTGRISGSRSILGIFAKIFNNKVLVVGMTAAVNR